MEYIESTHKYDLKETLGALEGVRQISDYAYMACCPAHNDRIPSLSITVKNDGRVLVYCHSGCSYAAIAKAMENPSRTPSEIFKAHIQKVHKVMKKKNRGSVVESYVYYAEDSTPLFQVRKYEDKSFSQHKADGEGGWLGTLGDARRVLYGLPLLLKATEGSYIYVVEGEKDANTLIKEGMFATTNSGGAGKWKFTDDTPLHGHHIIILPDNDVPGRNHATDIAKSLCGLAKTLRIIYLDNLPSKGDVSDWLKKHDAEDLDRLASGDIKEAKEHSEWLI